MWAGFLIGMKMSESLRDQLSAAYEEHVEQPAEPVAPSTGSGEATTPPSASTEGSSPPAADQEKSGRTAGRARDEKGRLLPGPAVKAEEKPLEAVVAAPVVQRPPRPSSWKKDYWDHWEKLDPKLAEYINQREGEYAKGVSTYKTEYDKAKPFLDAVAPFQGELQQLGIDPAQQIQRYFQIHKTFAHGSPQEKLNTFARLAQEYGVPIQEMFVQGQDGRLYINQQFQAQQAAPQSAQQPDVRKLVQEAMTEQSMQQQIAAMKSDSEKYPHFETVRNDMAGLLQAGLAQDLETAYSKALRMHDDLFAAQQEATRKADEAARLDAQRKATDAARRNNVSPRSATPAGQAKGAAKGSVRGAVEAAWDEHTPGRV